MTRDASVRLVGFLHLQVGQLGFHFATNLFGDVLDLIEKRAAGRVERIGVGGLAFRPGHRGITDLGNPLPDQRATLFLHIARQHERRVQGIEH